MKTYMSILIKTIMIVAFFGQIRCYEEDVSLKQVFGQCSEEHQISLEAIMSTVRHVRGPDGYQVKRWISCAMKKMGKIKEGEIDWEQCKILTKQGLTGKEDKAKVDKIAEIWQHKIPEEVKKERQLANYAPVCKFESWKELALLNI
ncbi:unnamed protein product [Nezara viridula]|uniref:Uncharacterized protein n=1 Tax=Nezara viridula TaxID=85310 RepID=A0A9P0EE84_NEZVI|nr:unnamed protein product [Nezara viridula]CAH1393493.1 unnamed protein product [Nezara viridula]